MGEVSKQAGKDIDVVMVERLMSEHPARQEPTDAEVEEAVRRLTDQGFSLREIALRVEISDRRVSRLHSRMGLVGTRG